MKRGGHIVLLAAARFYMPLIVLFAFALMAARQQGSGVGLIAGLAFALMLALHVLVYGANAARAAVPPNLSRVLLAFGMAAAVLGAGAPRWPYAGYLIEGGLFVTTAMAASLILAALAGRAPSLRDEDW